MGLRMRLGRPLGDDEVETAGQRVAVISEALWTTQFSASSAVIGQALYLNNERFTVVGVVERYRGWSLVFKDDVWIPAAEWSVVDRRTGPDPFDGGHFELTGRLTPGRTVASVESQLAGVFRHVDETRGTVRATALAPAVTLGLASLNQHSLMSRLRGIFTILASGSALLLLLALANAGSLALVRVMGRQREVAVRLALGASRWRLMRQLCVESAGLGSIAWALGLVVAVALVDVFRGTRLLDKQDAALAMQRRALRRQKRDAT